MNRFWRGAALGLFFASIGIIQAVDDPPKKDDPPVKKDDAAQTPAEKFVAAKKSYSEADAAFKQKMDELRKNKQDLSLENKEFNETYLARNKTMQALWKAGDALAKAEPSTPAAFDAINATIAFGNPFERRESHHGQACFEIQARRGCG